MGTITSRNSQVMNSAMMNTRAHAHFAESQLTLVNQVQAAATMQATAQAGMIRDQGIGVQGYIPGRPGSGYDTQQTGAQFRQQLLYQFVSLMAAAAPVIVLAGIGIYVANYYAPFLTQIEIFVIMFLAALSGYYAIMHSSVYYRGWVYTGKYTALGALVSGIIAGVLSFAIFHPPATAPRIATIPGENFNAKAGANANVNIQERAVGNDPNECITHPREIQGSLETFLIGYLQTRARYEDRFCVGDVDFMYGTEDELEANRIRALFGFSKYGIGDGGEKRCSTCKVLPEVLDDEFNLAELMEMRTKMNRFYHSPHQVETQVTLRAIVIDVTESMPIETMMKTITKIEKRFSMKPNTTPVHLVGAKEGQYIETGYKVHTTADLAERMDLVMYALLFVTTPNSTIGKLAALLRSTPGSTFLLGNGTHSIHGLMHSLDEKIGENGYKQAYFKTIRPMFQ